MVRLSPCTISRPVLSSREDPREIIPKPSDPVRGHLRSRTLPDEE